MVQSVPVLRDVRVLLGLPTLGRRLRRRSVVLHEVSRSQRTEQRADDKKQTVVTLVAGEKVRVLDNYANVISTSRFIP